MPNPELHDRPALLEARALAFARNDEPVFGPLDFTLHAGEVVLIEGDNGAGKTTLLRVLSGLLAATSGEIVLRGEPLTLARLSPQVALLSHQAGLKAELTALENLRFAAGLHGLRTGLYVWAFTVGLPALFSLWTIMLFNYDQHAHADPFSDYDHSRSFTSPILNFLLFNNGYHAAHHEQPGRHWSTLPALHRELAPRIHPSLNQSSLWWYWFKQYVLAPFFPRLGTVQLGPGPYSPPPAVVREFDAKAGAPDLEPIA